MYRRSLLSNRTFRKLAPSTCAARKDSAVHVSLSSSSLVKQPGAGAPTLRRGGLKTLHSTAIRPPVTTGWGFTHLNGELQRRDNVVSAGPSCCRRAQWPGYKPARSRLSTPDVNKSSHGGKESHRCGKPLFFRGSRRTEATIRRRPGAIWTAPPKKNSTSFGRFFCAVQPKTAAGRQPLWPEAVSRKTVTRKRPLRFMPAQIYAGSH